MKRPVLLILLIFAATVATAGTSTPDGIKDLYFGEALYHAYQGEWFDAVSRLDTEIIQHYGVDEREKDTLHHHINQAKFDVGDFELYYRMHKRAGRAIKAVIDGNVSDPVRNEALYRLARLYFQKDQPEDAQKAVDRIKGVVPAEMRDDLAFLKAQILMANGKFEEAAHILKGIQDVKALEGFSNYNLGIALIKDGKEFEGRKSLDRVGQLNTDDELTLGIKDKANMVLGEKFLAEKNYEAAKNVLDRVRLSGPFSDRALLGSGWADASLERYENALVPWTILSEREVTDSATQEAMLAVPYAYAKLGVYSKAAVMYGRALEAFSKEIDKLTASITSIREGKFLNALVREEIKQDPNWVVKLRELPETPETFYLLDLMASHDFQESLKNYLDLEELRKKLDTWTEDLSACEDMIEKRKAYYTPLLPSIDKEFRKLDSLMRLRLEQRDRIEKRLHAMLTAPYPEKLATANERIALVKLAQMEKKLSGRSSSASKEARARIERLRGAIRWNMYTDYDRRLTETFKHLNDLSREIVKLKKDYTAFVRVRQAATQSYEGYDNLIVRMRNRIKAAQEKVKSLMIKQGHILEVLATNELTARLERLQKYQVEVRFAMADSYDRARKAEQKKRVEP